VEIGVIWLAVATLRRGELAVPEELGMFDNGRVSASAALDGRPRLESERYHSGLACTEARGVESNAGVASRLRWEEDYFRPRPEAREICRVCKTRPACEAELA
jgi:hypothetical protein